VQGLLSSQFFCWPLQRPALQASSSVQRSPSLQPVPSGSSTKKQRPVAGLHEFWVQGLLSSQSGTSVAAHLALSLHALVAEHALPSSQTVPTGRCTFWQPCTLSQVSVVHSLLSLQSICVPTHWPAEHLSPLVQALPSLQSAVFATLLQPVVRLHESSVQGLLSLQLSAVPLRQAPDEQLSRPLHTSPSLQLVHALPPRPHCEVDVPAWQSVPLTQPVQHLPALHLPAPAAQLVPLALFAYAHSPLLHVAVWHSSGAVQIWHSTPAVPHAETEVPALQLPVLVRHPVQQFPPAHCPPLQLVPLLLLLVMHRPVLEQVTCLRGLDV
jgi:hypothetical protein